VGKKNTMAKNKAKTTHFCDCDRIFVLWVCFWIVTYFTKYFYADFSGCDPQQILFCDLASGWHHATHKAKKPLFICGMAKSLNVDYSHIVRLSLLLFRLYFDTFINLHGDIIKIHTPRLLK